MLKEIKNLSKDLKKYQSDAQFWMQKLNATGDEAKYKVT
jgi:hypothetical protein